MIRWILTKLGLLSTDYTREQELRAKLALCESPMEEAFLMAAEPVLSQYGDIIPQYPIFNYRADFAIPDCRILIEIDGYEWHKTREQLTADVKRQRALTAAGWTVFRFTGREIYAGAANCAAEVARIIVARAGGGW